MNKSLPKQGHGPYCPCLCCTELSACAARIVARDPKVRQSELEPAIAGFVFFHQNGKLKPAVWEQEGGAGE